MILLSWKKKSRQIFEELKHHAPFTATATLVAVVLVLVFYYFLEKAIPDGLFHIFHFSHIVVSAMVTAAIFYRYRPQFVGALFVGIAGAVVIGSISDIVFPYLGWLSLGFDIHFHLPLIEETFLVLVFAAAGSLIGVLTKMTKEPHFAHVFLSVFASLFYLLTFVTTLAVGYFLIVFLIVFVAVIIPCCLSDIVFPFLFFRGSKKEKTSCR